MTDPIHNGDFGLPSGIGKAVGDLERGARSSVNGLTAHAGGGQASATLLTAAVNVVGTVATAADSVKLPAATKNATVIAVNAGANSMNVFPATGETIDGGAANAAKAVAAGKTTMFVCAVDGAWRSFVGA